MYLVVYCVQRLRHVPLWELHLLYQIWRLYITKLFSGKDMKKTDCDDSKTQRYFKQCIKTKTCGELETQSLWISLLHLGMLYGTQESQFYILSHESFYLYCSTLTRIHLFHVSWQEAGKTWRQATTFTCYVQDKALFAFREKSRKCQATKINPVIVVCWGRIYWEYKKEFSVVIGGLLDYPGCTDLAFLCKAHNTLDTLILGPTVWK